MSKRAIGVLLVAVASVISAQARTTAGATPVTPEIYSASCDLHQIPVLQDYVIEIKGQNFGNSPVVIFNGTEPLLFTHYDFDSQTFRGEIFRNAPIHGNYRIDVFDEHGRSDSFVVTIFP